MCNFGRKHQWYATDMQQYKIREDWLGSGLPTCLQQKKLDLVPKNPDSSFNTDTHKTCVIKHKIDIKNSSETSI